MVILKMLRTASTREHGEDSPQSHLLPSSVQRNEGNEAGGNTSNCHVGHATTERQRAYCCTTPECDGVSQPEWIYRRKVDKTSDFHVSLRDGDLVMDELPVYGVETRETTEVDAFIGLDRREGPLAEGILSE